MMSVDPRLHGYSPERSVQLLTTVRQHVVSLPGVISAACSDAVPLSGGHRSDGFEVQGRPAPSGNGIVDLYMATPGYFDTMGIPRIAGRDFDNETATSPRTAVVNEQFVKRFFGNENPIGHRVRAGDRIYAIIEALNDPTARTAGDD